jgi:hypothetical protein
MLYKKDLHEREKIIIEKSWLNYNVCEDRKLRSWDDEWDRRDEKIIAV